MRQCLNKTRAASMTAMAVLAAASVAQAGFVLDLRLAGGGTSTSVSAGSTVNLEVIGTVSGSNAQIQDAFFSVMNSGTIGDLTPVSLSSPFNGLATDVTPNVETSFPGTPFGPAGSVDIGSTDNTSADGWVFARSTSMTPVTSGQPTVLGTLSFQVAAGAANGSSTQLTIAPRQADGSNLIVPALWQEDGVVKDATGLTAGEYTAGAGVSITVGGGPVLAGDFDGDGFVGGSDLNIVLGKWGQNVPAGNKLQGDGDGDGFVGGGDLNMVLGQWGQGTPPAIAALTAVPEPASLGLLGLAGLGLVARRRRA